MILWIATVKQHQGIVVNGKNSPDSNRDCCSAVTWNGTEKNVTKKIWQIQILTSTLRQFFVIHLSRKAEGNGPMTPWQPEMFFFNIKRC